jgi:adenylyltransferase/sulfurtransferase
MGVAPGLIGVLQASEALKHILGIGKSLTGRLLNIDLLSMTMHDTQMQPDPECPMCGSNGGAGDP